MVSPILQEREGVILLVTLNRPQVHNAINPEITEGLETLLNDAEHDEGVGVIIVSGSGEKSFCVGADIKHITQHGIDGLLTGNGFAGVTQRRFKKPIVAAVNGRALGGGFEIALACDLIVAAQTATFGLPEVRLGWMAGAGGLVRLGRRVSRNVALEMAMTGEAISAQRAYEIGLVNRVVDGSHLLETAKQLALAILQNGPLAVQLSKRLIEESNDLSLDEAWVRMDAYGRQVANSGDAQEGIRAFLEKRKANWKGV